MPDKKERNGLSTPLKRFFGVGDFGFTLMSNIDTFYATYFFTNIAKFSLGVITVMTTISAVVDAILSCLYGPFLNKIKPKRWGRYRSWLILTPWMVPFLYAMQFIKIGNGLAAAIFVTVAMITSRIAWNIPYIANVSMINIAGKTPKERMTLSSTRMVWTSLASVVYSYAGPAAVSVFAAWLGEKNAYAATAFAFSALMAAGFYAHFNMFKGYEMTKEEELQRMAGQARSAQTAPNAQKVRALDAIRCNPHLLWLFLSCITKYIVLFLVNGLAIYYFTYVGQNAALLTTFVFAANLLGVVASYISKFIVGRFTAKKTVVCSYFLMAVIATGAFFAYSQTWVVMAAMCAVMFILVLTNACDPELFSNCAAYSGKKLGYDVTGTVMGLLTVPIKIGIVSRGILISACLALAQFSSETDPSMASLQLQRGISMGFMIIPAVVILLGAVILAFGYKLDQDT